MANVPNIVLFWVTLPSISFKTILLAGSPRRWPSVPGVLQVKSTWWTSISTSQTKRTKQKIFAVSLWNRPLVGARSLLQLQISFNFRFRTTATTLHRFLHTWYQNTRTFCTIWSYTFHTFFTGDGRIERFFQKLCLLLKKTNILPWFFICWKSKISAKQILPLPLRFLLD